MSNSATIIIPTYNRPNSLRRAIQSALEQTVPTDVIVVDHGSDEETGLVVREFGDSCKYLRRDFDSGPIFAWCDGLITSQADVVKLLFDDDWIGETFMEKTLPFFSDPEVGFVYTAASIVDLSTGKVITDRFMDHASSSGVFSVSDHKNLFQQLVSPTALVMRRQDMLDAMYLGRLPFQTMEYKGVGPDHAVRLLAGIRYRSFGFVREKLAYFGSHPGSITVQSATAKADNLRLAEAYRQTNEHFSYLTSREIPVYLRGISRALRFVRGWTRLIAGGR